MSEPDLTNEVVERLIQVMVADEVEGLEAPHVLVFEHLPTGTVWYRGPYPTGLAAATAVEAASSMRPGWTASLARLFPPLAESVLPAVLEGAAEEYADRPPEGLR